MFNVLTRDAMPLEGEAIRYYFMLILALPCFINLYLRLQ